MNRRIPLPSLDALYVFEAAARLGSFKGAAAELSVTATAVSHRIRALEEALACPLFVRQVRAVTLTRDDQPDEQVSLLMKRRNLFGWKLAGIDLSKPE